MTQSPSLLPLRLASIYGALAVAFGAFGAHGLEKKVAPELLAHWITAAHYHLVHAVVLLAIALFVLAKARSKEALPRLPVAFWLFVTGITLFSGSLYLYTLTGVKKLAMVTPIGGLFLLLGWLALAFTCRQRSTGE